MKPIESNVKPIRRGDALANVIVGCQAAALFAFLVVPILVPLDARNARNALIFAKGDPS
jgi:uncharacterized membrane protein YccC